MNEQYDRIKKYIEEKIEYSLDDLTEKSTKVGAFYKPKFSTNTIYGEYCFHKIAGSAYYREKTGYWTLAEKCMRRKQDIQDLKYYYNNKKMLAAISDAEVFSELMMRAIPLEVLWAMEYEQEDDYLFVEPEKSAFNYLKIIAKFYLEQTQKYEDLLEQAKVKEMKKQKRKKKTK